jgi:hypothetical protein
MKEQLISSSPSSFSEDEDDLQQFTINEHYAKAFQYRKEREELAKRTHRSAVGIRAARTPADFFFLCFP